MKKIIRTMTGFAAMATALCIATTNGLPAQAADTPHTNYGHIVRNADVVAYDTAGTHWNYGNMYFPGTPRRQVGPAGAAIPKSFFVTNWNGDQIADLVVHNMNGTLTYREGTGTGFKDHSIGSGGWENYEITVGKWKKTDRYPSIIARNNATGELFNYGNQSGKDLSPPVKIGSGWNGYTFNLLDWDKDGNEDVVARNSAGQIRLYRTNGAGSFIPETRATIGGGWNGMTFIRTLTGHNGFAPVKTVGLLALDGAGVLHYYQADKNSWAPRKTFGKGWGPYTIAGN